MKRYRRGLRIKVETGDRTGLRAVDVGCEKKTTRVVSEVKNVIAVGIRDGREGGI